MARIGDDEIRIVLAEQTAREVIQPEIVITDPPARELKVRVAAPEPADPVVLKPKVVVIRDRRAD